MHYGIYQSAINKAGMAREMQKMMLIKLRNSSDRNWELYHSKDVGEVSSCGIKLTIWAE